MSSENTFWFVHHRIAYIRAAAQNIEHYRIMCQQIVAMLDSSEAKTTHLLIDHAYLVPAMAAIRIRDVQDDLSPILQHQRCGWVINFNTPDKLFEVRARMMAQLNDAQIYQAATPQDAIKFLRNVDNTLPDIPAIDLFIRQLRLN